MANITVRSASVGYEVIATELGFVPRKYSGLTEQEAQNYKFLIGSIQEQGGKWIGVSMAKQILDKGTWQDNRSGHFNTVEEATEFIKTDAAKYL